MSAKKSGEGSTTPPPSSTSSTSVTQSPPPLTLPALSTNVVSSSSPGTVSSTSPTLSQGNLARTKDPSRSAVRAHQPDVGDDDVVAISASTSPKPHTATSPRHSPVHATVTSPSSPPRPYSARHNHFTPPPEGETVTPSQPQPQYQAPQPKMPNLNALPLAEIHSIGNFVLGKTLGEGATGLFFSLATMPTTCRKSKIGFS